MKNFYCLFASFLLCAPAFAQEYTDTDTYRLWYDEPAPDRGGHIPAGESDRPLDLDWERWSLPIGNGFMGGSVFGGIQSERIQMTDKTLYVRGLWGTVTHTSFCDLYIDFFHTAYTNYTRSLNLNEGRAEVAYDYQGVHYTREYFMSYPDNVMAIKLTADKPGSLSFTVRPSIPHLVPFGQLQRPDSITIGYLSGQTQSRFSYNGREGRVTANKDLITLHGKTEYLNMDYEAQFKVIPQNGTLTSWNDARGGQGRISVREADSAIILVALGTNYQLRPEVFAKGVAKKLDGFELPHQQVSERIQSATQKGYDELRKDHVADFSSLFNRVDLHLAETPKQTTDALLADYKQGNSSNYLEELMFHYGRYLLISSARKGSLPPTLQGVWNQYELAPWNGNYTHNINIQMNYWPAFTTNLIDLFETYVDYYKAYKPTAEKLAASFVKKFHADNYSSDGKGNGWTIGISSSPYNVSMPSGHTGPGVSAFTSKLFWEYYQFTHDKQLLKETVYPAIYGVAQFLSKAVTDTLGCLLAYPSASPEQFSKLTGKPYRTIGCAFDQQMIFENHRDVIEASRMLRDRNKEIQLFKDQSKRLSPVLLGASGQVKEYREEKFYGDLVLEQHHRHISHLVGLYPGTQINELTPAWLDAAKVTLNRRGDVSTGWSMAHKLNLWARTKEGNRAHDLLEGILKTAVLDNLWTNCQAVLRSPFQIDANLGTTAGIAEMLLQSHEGYLNLLPAIPDEWSTGSYRGLTARGGFEVDVTWKEHRLMEAEIRAKVDNRCAVKYPNISSAVVKDANGKVVRCKIEGKDLLTFNAKKGASYRITGIPQRKQMIAPTDLTASITTQDVINLSWKCEAKDGTYRVYRSRGSQPDYELVTSNLTDTHYQYKLDAEEEFVIFKVVREESDGHLSKGVTTCFCPTEK